MTKAVNPFKPTAGMNPPELIGRDTVLDDFAEALENGPGAPRSTHAHLGRPRHR